ncbi:thioesterase II family protein [Parvularcula sp. LCG005]|uniref:thioesterase II family protein n=1 Tax=Parvularcula sp. LCG005 TaxID=3078805 RepID=UPI0029435DA3|nr:alpha/beta fold hydrolase [Parvularcula sp. LCG005]WOI51990.1 alpha/beta fold hydrolase [Parvularcula sp. LCG005]
MTTPLICLSPRPMASTRLVCIPFAGAGASVYRRWASLLPPNVELFAVQLPGRENRLSEPPMTEWDLVVASIADALIDMPWGNYRLFGHSLGALLALDVARSMTKRGEAQRHLAVSGRPWPGFHNDVRSPIAVDVMSDDDVLEELTERFGPLPDSLRDLEIRDIVMPTLRADLQLLHNYRWQSDPVLTGPVTAFYGQQDPSLSKSSVAGWAKETSGAFAAEPLNGGHYMLDQQSEAICRLIELQIRTQP